MGKKQARKRSCITKSLSKPGKSFSPSVLLHIFLNAIQLLIYQIIDNLDIRTLHSRRSGFDHTRTLKLPQGIADVVLVFDDHAEILDYKTDKSRNATYYIESYAAQLRLYRRAFALRLPVPVTKLTIYSFAMQDEIDIPLE